MTAAGIGNVRPAANAAIANSFKGTPPSFK
jgi:hypothetical protein